MKFSCLQENLSKGLGIVGRAVPVKSSLPILSNVLISAENGQVKLAATNLETTVVTYIGASVDEEGSTTVPAKLIKEYISNLSPGTHITFQLKEDILNVTSDRTRSKFNCVNPADYPTLPTFPKGAKYLELDPKIFALAINNVAFAAASDHVRPVFSGILLNFSNDQLTAASSDGFRLSEKQIKVEGKGSEFYTIIPAKTLLEVTKIFINSEEPIKFVLNKEENMALFEAEDTLVATQVLSGEYPDYRKIIPDEHLLTAEIMAEGLLEAVKLTTVFAREMNSAIKLRFSSKGFVSVISMVQETGEHESKMEAEIDGEELEIAFNSKYLLDLLNNVKSEKIVIKTKSSTTPCIFQPLEHNDYLHVIAPMQIQS
jgi:DNA polymerase III subunit beta